MCAILNRVADTFLTSDPRESNSVAADVLPPEQCYAIPPHACCHRAKSVHMSHPCHTHPRRLLIGLHLLADLHRDIKKLRHAPIQADGLALVQLWFPVVGGNALLGT